MELYSKIAYLRGVLCSMRARLKGVDPKLAQRADEVLTMTAFNLDKPLEQRQIQVGQYRLKE